MSTATELAELDAAIAENELTDAEAETLRERVSEGVALREAVDYAMVEREESAPPEAPPEAATGEPTQKQWTQLAAETERHTKRVQSIMGAYVDGFEECGPCGGVGLVPPGPPPAEMKPHEWFKACATCDGIGEVLTGSLRPGQEARNCPTCLGRGYLELLDQAGTPVAPDSGVQAAPDPLAAHAPIDLPPEPARNGGGEASYGVPAWMGDPGIGR